MILYHIYELKRGLSHFFMAYSLWYLIPLHEELQPFINNQFIDNYFGVFFLFFLKKKMFKFSDSSFFYECFLVSFVLYDVKMNIFGLWTVGQDERRHFMDVNFWLWEKQIDSFYNFSNTFSQSSV